MDLPDAAVSGLGSASLRPGGGKPAVDDFNLEIADGELMALVGRSKMEGDITVGVRERRSA